MTAQPDPGVDERRLEEESARIERLLGELQATAGPQVWPRVEELVRRLVGLYAAGLGRLLALAADAARSDADLASRLDADELLSSLLVLHGLHPRGTDERVRRALAELQPYLGSHAGGVEVVAIENGVVRLRLLGTCRGCPSSRSTVQDLIRASLEAAAPELAAIEVDGASEAALSLVPLGGVRGPRREWRVIPWADSLAAGAVRVFDGAPSPVLVARLGASLVAYEDRCPGCGGRPVESGCEATLDGSWVACSGCGARYDLARAGLGAGTTDAALPPVPLLPSPNGARVAIEDVR